MSAKTRKKILADADLKSAERVLRLEADRTRQGEEETAGKNRERMTCGSVSGGSREIHWR